MSPGNPARLLKLVDREFCELTGEPARTPPPPRFKALKLNASRFYRSWDRERGAAVRCASGQSCCAPTMKRSPVRVCESEQTAKTYAGGAQWLQREAAHLRKIARLLDTAFGQCILAMSAR